MKYTANVLRAIREMTLATLWHLLGNIDKDEYRRRVESAVLLLWENHHDFQDLSSASGAAMGGGAAL